MFNEIKEAIENMTKEQDHKILSGKFEKEPHEASRKEKERKLKLNYDIKLSMYLLDKLAILFTYPRETFAHVHQNKNSSKSFIRHRIVESKRKTYQLNPTNRKTAYFY